MTEVSETPWRNLREKVFVPPGCVTIPAAFEAIGRKALAHEWQQDEMFAVSGEANERRLAVLEIMHRLAAMGVLHIYATNPDTRQVSLVAKQHWNRSAEVVLRRFEEAALSSAPEYLRDTVAPRNAKGANDLPIFVRIDNLRHTLAGITYTPFDNSAGDSAQAEAALFQDDAPQSAPVIHSSSASKAKAREWLAEQFKDASTLATTKSEFLDLAQAEITNLSERSFKEVWSELAADYPERTRRGPRPKP